MSGVTLTVTWDREDLAKVKRGLQLLERAGRDMRPILAEAGEVVVEHTWERWARGRERLARFELAEVFFSAEGGGIGSRADAPVTFPSAARFIQG
jgi:hypothetical protein